MLSFRCFFSTSRWSGWSGIHQAAHFFHCLAPLFASLCFFFGAHFFHCLALYFCFVDTSSTITFYISLGFYKKKLQLLSPYGNTSTLLIPFLRIFLRFYEHLLSIHLHLLLLFFLGVFLVYVLVFQSLFGVMCKLLCAHFQDFFPCISCI